MSNNAGSRHFFRSKRAIFCVLYCVGCSFYHSLFFSSLFFPRRVRQCPSEKSINLAHGLANVRTIRQRADWWEGMDSRRVGEEEGGYVRGWTRVRWTLQLRPTCNKAATILRARRAGWRGNLPTRWERDEGTTRNESIPWLATRRFDRFDKGRRFLPDTPKSDVTWFSYLRGIFNLHSRKPGIDLTLEPRMWGGVVRTWGENLCIRLCETGVRV